MKSYTAPAFSEKFISLRSSWRYCLDSFAGTFEELLQRGALCESSSGEIIWSTRNKYVIKLPAENGTSVAYKGFRRITKPCSYLLRPSACGSEAVNYQRIADLGIPVPELLAAGEERVWFRLKNAFLITRFAEGFLNGRYFLEGAPHEAEHELRDEFLRRHLALLAHFHDCGMIHRGFTPANIMWKKRSGPDAEGNRLDLLWLDLASCRKVPLPYIALQGHTDIAACLDPFGFSREKSLSFVEVYCAARKKVPPRLQALEAKLFK